MCIHALPAFRNYGKYLKEDATRLWPLLLEIVTKLQGRKIVFIIDALDECIESDRVSFIKKIVEYYRSAEGSRENKLKILVTSRPYPSIEGSFASSRYVASFLHFEAEAETEAISRDINFVIDVRLSDVTVGLSVAQRERLRRSLHGKQNRTYLWVHLILDRLQKRLNDCLDDEQRDRLVNEPPQSLDGIYASMLKRDIAGEPSNDHGLRRKNARLLLQLIVAAKRPLTLLELLHAYHIHNDEVCAIWPASRDQDILQFHKQLRSIVNLFVIVHDEKVYLLHATAQEFLLKCRQNIEDKDWEDWQHFDLETAHAVMARSCVKTLTLPLEAQCKPRYSGFRDRPCWCHRCLCGGFQRSFQIYTVQNWFHHFRSADTAIEAGIIDIARHLCNPEHSPYHLWACKGHQYDYDGGDPQNMISVLIMTPLSLSIRYDLPTLTERILQDTPTTAISQLADELIFEATYTKAQMTALAYAYKMHHVQMVRVLLAAGFLVMQTPVQAFRTFTLATKSGFSDQELLKPLIIRSEEIIIGGWTEVFLDKAGHPMHFFRMVIHALMEHAKLDIFKHESFVSVEAEISSDLDRDSRPDNFAEFVHRALAQGCMGLSIHVRLQDLPSIKIGSPIIRLRSRGGGANSNVWTEYFPWGQDLCTREYIENVRWRHGEMVDGRDIL